MLNFLAGFFITITHWLLIYFYLSFPDVIITIKTYNFNCHGQSQLSQKNIICLLKGDRTMPSWLIVAISIIFDVTEYIVHVTES